MEKIVMSFPQKAIIVNDIQFYYIKGYEGYYAISKCGLVFSLPRVSIRGNGYKYPIKGRILKAFFNTSGYLQVILCKKKKNKKLAIHRVVVETFIKPIPKNKEVNHKNGIKTDNNLNNLEIVNHKENMRHAIENGLYSRKMTTCLLENIKTGGVRQFESIYKLADFLNVCNQQVNIWLQTPHKIRLNKYLLRRTNNECTYN